MLNAEMDVHLGGETEQDGGNHRNGSSRKTVLSDDGELVLSIPRDRHGRFDPALIRKYQRRFPGFDDKIVALYARGMSTRDIQAHVGELYGIAISPDLVSVVTDSVIDEVRAWQARPLESTYAIVYFDALRVKIRGEGLVRNKAVYLAIGVRCSGHKDILGLWIEQTEGAKFWLRVMNDLKARGVQDILLAVVDGLKGFPDAITAVFPDTIVQTCIVHLIRNSIRLAAWKDRKPLVQALKPVYQADDVNGNRKPHICGNRKLHTPGEDVSGGADILPVMPVGRVGLDAGSGATGVQPNTRREAAEPAVTLRLPHAVRPTLSSASADAPASGSCCPGC